MSPINLPASFRSTRTRVAAALIGLFVVTFGSSGLATWAALSEPVDAGIESRLRHEMAIVQTLYSANRPAAARLIQARERRPSGFEFQITNPRGQRVAGDLPRQPYTPGLDTVETAPSAVPDVDNNDDSDEADKDVGQRIRVLTVAAADGALLTLGEDLGRTRALKALFLRAFILTSGAALMIALAVGLSYVSHLLGRIEVIARTADAVSVKTWGCACRCGAGGGTTSTGSPFPSTGCSTASPAFCKACTRCRTMWRMTCAPPWPT